MTLAVLLLASSSPARAGRLVGVAPGEVLLSLSCRSTSGPRLDAAASGVATISESSSRLGVCRLRLRPGVSMEAALARLRAHPGVAFAEPNLLFSLEEAAESALPEAPPVVELPPLVPDDPGFPFQYAPQRVQADRAWQIFAPRANVVVAIVDSGIDATHPDLADAILRNESGIVGFDALTRRAGAADDEYYHGTHCAGIAAARVGNGLGIAGIAGLGSSVKLMPVKVFDRFGRGSSYSVAEGIRWAADHGARVISLSLGSPLYAATLAQAVAYAQEKGCLVVAAAGNQGSSAPSYPAALPGVLAVAATDRDDLLAPYSNFGPWVSLAAPGHQILSTTPTRAVGGRVERFYDLLSGTSMACPVVAAEAALLMAQNPDLKAADVARLIAAHVDPYLPFTDRALAPGAGRVNVYRGLLAANGGAETTALGALILTPDRVEGGQSAIGTVLVLGPPPAEDLVVTLTSGAPELASVPTEAEAGADRSAPLPVVVPAGASSASFSLTTQAVTRLTTIPITAAALGKEVRATLLLEPVAGIVTGLAVEPPAATGGASVRAVVTISRPAPAGGVRVSLSADRPEALALPESVTIPAGATTQMVPLATRSVGTEMPVEITASLGGAAEQAVLTLLPPPVQAVLLRPNVSRINRQITVTAMLAGPAPAGGLTLRLTSDHPELIEAPASVHVPEGASVVTFGLLANPAAVQTPVQVRLSSDGGGASSILTILPIFSTPAPASTKR